MAKFKKSAEQPGSGARSTQEQAEHLQRTLTDSAQQVWLAGVGALGRAQAEGSKLFETLVKEGTGVERETREFADRQAKTARSSVESTMDQARERATQGWDRLERAFEQRVHLTLGRLGVPDRNELSELSRRVDELTGELRKQRSAQAARKSGVDKSKTSPAGRKSSSSEPSPRASPPKKTTRKSAVKKAAAKSTSAVKPRKTARKSASPSKAKK